MPRHPAAIQPLEMWRLEPAEASRPQIKNCRIAWILLRIAALDGIRMIERPGETTWRFLLRRVRSEPLVFAMAMTGGFAVQQGQASEPVDPSTLDGKMVMGYQGWFSCPGDAARRGWGHWKERPEPEVIVEMLPDVSELSPGERCDSGLVARNGKPVSFFSRYESEDRRSAFPQWMEAYGIDGVALQRFASVLLRPEILKASDAVLANARAGAEEHGRAFFLMYDISGPPPEKLELVVEDWRRLDRAGLHQQSRLSQPQGPSGARRLGNRLRGARPSPAETDGFLTQLRDASEAAGGVTVLGGVPAGWREGRGDASAGTRGGRRSGRSSMSSAPGRSAATRTTPAPTITANARWRPDLAATKAMGVDYMPVVFPAFPGGT